MLWPPSINRRPRGISQFSEISTESPIIGMIFTEKGDFSIFFKNSGKELNLFNLDQIGLHHDILLQLDALRSQRDDLK